MKKYALLTVATILFTLSTFAGDLQKEGLLHLMDGKYWKICDPAQQKLTRANFDNSLADQLAPYEGKVVRITGESNPQRHFSTFLTIEKIEVLED